ncbi:hypothetical protein C8R43DRAFT_878501 [Mycena crocata]|nr:hypothetical protein C8R43DRAFT_878501 [Mycena crocata]
MSIRIDDDTALQSTYPIPQEYRQWYTSPTLSDATHTVVLDDLVWIDLDYAIITAGTSTSLSGTTLIVDDNDPDLVYGGRWTNNRDLFTIGHGQPSGLPFQNATHESNTIGDSMTFQFAGTSVGVYGLFKWNIPGSITASFSVDGKSTAQTFSSSQAPFEEQPNFEFFHATGLQPGNHTLVVNITDVVGAQSLMFDYILYHPSFDSLASKPNFTAASSISPSAPAKSPILNKSHHKNTAAIVGGVMGGLILIVLLGVVFLLWNRARRRSARDSTSGDNGVFASKIDGAHWH